MFFVFEIFLFSKKRYCYLAQILKHKKLKLVLIKRTRTSNFLSPQLFLQSSYSLPVGFQQINNLCLSEAPGPVHSHPERVAQVFLSDFSLQKTSTNSTSCEETTDTTLLYPFLYCYQRCYRWICNFPF